MLLWDGYVKAVKVGVIWFPHYLFTSLESDSIIISTEITSEVS